LGVPGVTPLPRRREKRADSTGQAPPSLTTPAWWGANKSYLSVLKKSRRLAPAAPMLLLLDDLADHSRADGAPTLSDGEAQTLVHGDRLDQLDLHLNVVAGRDHLDALGQLGHDGD